METKGVLVFPSVTVFCAFSKLTRIVFRENKCRLPKITKRVVR